MRPSPRLASWLAVLGLLLAGLVAASAIGLAGAGQQR